MPGPEYKQCVTPPCKVTEEGNALYRALAALSKDLCLQEWPARILIEDWLLRAKGGEKPTIVGEHTFPTYPPGCRGLK